jgi:hypothetical protein
MAKKHIKKCSPSLAKKDMQVKTTIKITPWGRWWLEEGSRKRASYSEIL